MCFSGQGLAGVPFTRLRQTRSGRAALPQITPVDPVLPRFAGLLDPGASAARAYSISQRFSTAPCVIAAPLA